MSKTTTDFDTRLGEIFDKHTIALTNAYEARNDIKKVVSELVRECIGEDKPVAMDEDDTDDAIESIKTQERKEIRQRFKERGIEIK